MSQATGIVNVIKVNPYDNQNPATFFYLSKAEVDFTNSMVVFEVLGWINKTYFTGGANPGSPVWVKPYVVTFAQYQTVIGTAFNVNGNVPLQIGNYLLANGQDFSGGAFG